MKLYSQEGVLTLGICLIVVSVASMFVGAGYVFGYDAGQRDTPERRLEAAWAQYQEAKESVR